MFVCLVCMSVCMLSWWRVCVYYHQIRIWNIYWRLRFTSYKNVIQNSMVIIALQISLNKDVLCRNKIVGSQKSPYYYKWKSLNPRTSRDTTYTAEDDASNRTHTGLSKSRNFPGYDSQEEGWKKDAAFQRPLRPRTCPSLAGTPFKDSLMPDLPRSGDPVCHGVTHTYMRTQIHLHYQHPSLIGDDSD